MNTIHNRQVINDVLVEKAFQDKQIVVLCSDSRGSASLAEFAKVHPRQFVETGIAEQNIVSIAAGLASCGKKAFVASPACFLSTRSMEQAKVDVAYSNTNVKLIGISGGVSYGALGMTHHSTNDIATMASIPNMRVYFPSDRHQTKRLIEALLTDQKPAYVRVGRNPVADVYTESACPFVMDHASLARAGSDVTLIATGELVDPAIQAAQILEKQGISCRVIDMYCIKPLDREAVLQAARETQGLVVLEEHVAIGGLGSMISQLIASEYPVKFKSLCLPDEPAIAGKSPEVFAHYGLTPENIAVQAAELIGR
ncbi:MAG: transketolase C-terminal domain-containing protein [Eubacteriales bacterium]|nr:transketolase C-terminal domain-containing protein [Eubacteriales bacterium]